MSFQRCKAPPRLQPPELDGPIFASRQGEAAITTEGDGRHGAKVAVENEQTLPRRDFPQTHGAVGTTRQGEPAIRTQGPGVDLVAVPRKSLEAVPASDV